MTGKLNPALHTWLCSLTRSMKEENAEALLNQYSGLKNVRDKKNAGVIVDFVSNVNEELFLQILKGSDHMTEEMKVLVAPEIVELRLIIKNQATELANNKKELADNKKELASNKKKLVSNEKKLADNKKKLADNKKELANNKKELEYKDMELANKEAEIERRKRQLEEFMKKEKENGA